MKLVQHGKYTPVVIHSPFKWRAVAWCALGGALLLCACEKQGEEPLTASSADQGGYAERYPDALGSSRQEFSDQESKSTELNGKFAAYPDALKDPSWPQVRSVVDQADSAGKSSSYAERLKENQAVAKFFKEEGGEIGGKVGGSANYVAKQKGCDVDVSGAARAALDKAVEKQLEKRLRENNEGQRFIEDNSDSLGTANVKTLQEQADEISLASYLANVGVKQTRKDLQARIEESTAVKNTLDREIEATKKASQDPARSEGEKAQAQKRQQAAEAAKAKIDSEVQQAQQLQQQLEERIKKVQEAYQKSLEDLRKKIDEKAKEKGSETKEPEKGKGSQKKS